MLQHDPVDEQSADVPLAAVELKEWRRKMERQTEINTEVERDRR